jgi:6-phosphogluconate dehydrogenase
MKSSFGIVGLGVMGTSISRNLARSRVSLSVYNQKVIGVEESVALNCVNTYPELKNAKPFEELEAFIESLESPKKVFLMVKAGEVVDQVIGQLIPLLDAGDVIIDGGNSFYKDTNRRTEELEVKGIHFIGTGVSGGEEGALKGPSIMPGGDFEAYKLVSSFLELMAAQDSGNKKCCTWIGEAGAGHFVKMVHNGIEYAEMQLLAELYGILKNGGQFSNEVIADLFSEWHSTGLSSYLLEITIQILKKKGEDGYLLDEILDKAGNKGTGSWTTAAAGELGVPIPTISSALFSRFVSSYKSERIETSRLYGHKYEQLELDLDLLRSAYQTARIVNHHQGFHLIQEASKEYEWNINLSELARIWTNGCIIRSELMVELVDFLKDGLPLFNEKMIKSIDSKSLSESVSIGLKASVPVPCFSASASYLLGIQELNSSANLIQAQRDFFGAHTYQRKEDSSGQFYHTNWTE